MQRVDYDVCHLAWVNARMYRAERKANTHIFSHGGWPQILFMASGNVLKRIIASRVWSSDGHAASELRYAALVALLVRWVGLSVCVFEVNYRVEYGALSHVLNNVYNLSIVGASVYVWWRIRVTGRVYPSWLFLLSVLDVAAITFSVSISGGIESRYFPMYYFALALFCWLFTSPYLVFSWTTLVAVVYTAACLLSGDGLNLAEDEEKELFFRVLALYGVTVSANLVTRFERMRGARAVQREAELSRQRIEMSQTIHDTTAQSAYMLGLGLEGATERAREVDGDLAGRLGRLSDLSKSTMWALRHPIDGGDIFDGATLGQVLVSHVDTFTVITSIPAELVQEGEEPELSTIRRSLLLSIAHNALTNAFRHSQASRVKVRLDFGVERLRLSVSDDGRGLPEDYASRGHGFRNMRADAERMGGLLEVHSDYGGTTVCCTVPFQPAQGGN